MSLQKQIIWRDKRYTNWVKKQLSCISMQQADDPHHIKGMKKGSTKPHDLLTMPLTSGEHTELHYIGYQAWEKENGTTQALEILRMIDKAVSEGVIEIRFVGDK